MTGMRVEASAIIRELRHLLNDRYDGEFSVLKELVQNADDAEATRLLVAAHAGFESARNPLLRAPGVIVANDGTFCADDAEKMALFSSSTKMEDASKVGRFGLGQKAVFHLCDAFVARGWTPNGPNRAHSQVVNPFVGLPLNPNYALGWEDLPQGDEELLDAWLRDAGFESRGLALVLPLRSAALEPAPGRCLGRNRFDPARVIACFDRPERLLPIVAGLRHLERIGFCASGGSRVVEYRLQPEAGRLAPSDPGGGGEAAIGGVIRQGGKATARHVGRQRWVANGLAAAIAASPDWPLTEDSEGLQIREKSLPHGAAIALRTPNGPNRLRVHWSVFLPVLETAQEESSLPDGTGTLDIVLHGYFFVDSGRKKINFGSGGEDDNVRQRWNRALRDEATLPLLLPVVADAIRDLGFAEAAIPGVVRMIAEARWFRDHAEPACGDFALAEVLNDGATVWCIVPRETLRPLPSASVLSPKQVAELFPALAEWSGQDGERLLCFDGGALLAASGVGWKPGELAELIEMAGAQAVQRRTTAQTLALLLQEISLDPAARDAVARIVRAALREPEQGLAKDASLERIVSKLHDDALFPLPPSVEQRRVFAALAEASGRRLPVKASWARERRLAALDPGTAVDFLSGLEPLLQVGGAVAEEAAAAVGAVIAAGPALSQFLHNERARHLRVVRARDAVAGSSVFLTLQEVDDLGGRGLLFRQPGTKLLKHLAEAVCGLPLYEIKAGEEDAARFRLRPADRRSVLAAIALAPEFGPAAPRAELLALLGGDGDAAEVEPLRALCAGKRVVLDTRLLELDRLSKALEPLAQELLDEAQSVIVETAITNGISPRMKNLLGIERLDGAWIGRELIKALEENRLPDIDDGAAQALIVSDVPTEAIERLPLHLSTGGKRVALDGPLFQAKASEIPVSLLGEIALLAPWNDPDVEARQRQLVPRWSRQAQLERALASVHPERHSLAILDAASSLDLTGYAAPLRDKAWIAVDAGGYCPADILSLDAQTDAAARALFGDAGTFLPFDRLPAEVREHPALAKLREAAIFPDRAQSHQALALDLRERGDICGCLADPKAELDELRALAAAGADLALPGWRLLRALLAGGAEAADALEVAEALCAPADEAALVAHLNALAEAAASGPAGEAARRLHRSIFRSQLAELRNAKGFLPADLMVRSRTGSFRKAADVSASGDGIDPSHVLDRDYAQALLEGAGALGEEDSGTAAPAAAESGGEDFVAGIESVFEPWRDCAPSDAIIFLLGLLGRDGKMENLAEKWQGSARRPARFIWEDIDAAVATTGLPSDELVRVLAETQFVLEPVRDETMVTVSAAGAHIRVPLSGANDAMLLGDPVQRRRKVAAAGGGVFYEVPLSIANRASGDQQAARRLFEQFIDVLAPALVFGMPSQKQALRDAFDKVFASDQALVEDTEAELRDIASERVRGLKMDDGVVREALIAFDESRHKDPAAAKRRFWEVVKSPQAAPELLAAVRRKIKDMGYSDGRTLFELFQNADDALAGWSGGESFRVEIERDEDGLPSMIRVVHWGRPINRVVPGAQGAAAADNRRDLANMLAIGHSDKRREEEETGKFGLGFKTAHMLSSDVRVASGFVTARISGGLIPHIWDEGFEVARAFNRGNDKATLIELPIDSDRRQGAECACREFKRAAPWLTAFSRHIRNIEWQEGADG